MNIYRENSEDIAFVMACLLSEAITSDELRKWAEYVLESEEHYPGYILELLEYDGNPTKIHRLLGFTPVWNSTPPDQIAVTGIVFARGRKPFEKIIPENDAMVALEKSTAVKALFAKNFPFINVAF